MFELFKQDVRRWVVPQQIAPASAVTFGKTLKLLILHKPLRAMVWFRLAAWCHAHRVRLVPSFANWVLGTFYGLEIAITKHYGGGLYIPHTVGTVIYADRLGENCSIIANITIGMRNEYAFPVIGDNVFIGAGARVLGGITVGSGAVIGANAVVIQDVPPGATAVGVPARLLRTADNQPSPMRPSN